MTSGGAGGSGPPAGPVPGPPSSGAPSSAQPPDAGDSDDAPGTARDWADTGDPAHEPILPPGHPGVDPEELDGPAAEPGPVSGPGPAPVPTPEPEAGPAAEPGPTAQPSAELGRTPEHESTAQPGADLGRTPEYGAEPGPTPEPRTQGSGTPESGTPQAPAPTPGPEGLRPRERKGVRPTAPPQRPPLLVQGLAPALLAAGLAGCAALGVLPLAAAILGVQVLLVLGALALLDAPAAGGAFWISVGTTVAADVVVLAEDGRIDGLAGVAGLGLVAAMLHQLARRQRTRVTESLADTLLVIVISAAAACLIALHQVDGGEAVLMAGLAATGAVLLAGRVVDRVAPAPLLAVGATRGWPGLAAGLVAGVAAASVVAELGGDLPGRSAALLGLVVAGTVATADLAVDLGAAELRSGWRDARRAAALRPTALLLPYAVLGPVALLAGRLVLT